MNNLESENDPFVAIKSIQSMAIKEIVKTSKDVTHLPEDCYVRICVQKSNE